MTTVSKPLVTAAYAANSQTTVYTAPTGTRTIVDKISAYNGTGAGVTLAINIVPSAGSAGASNLLVSKTIAAGVTENFSEIVGQVLEPGGFISVIAGSASAVVLRISGRETT